MKTVFLFVVVLSFFAFPAGAFAEPDHAGDGKAFEGDRPETEQTRAQDALRKGRQQITAAGDTVKTLVGSRTNTLEGVMTSLGIARTSLQNTRNVLGDVRKSMIEVGRSLEADDAEDALMPPAVMGGGLFARRNFARDQAAVDANNAAVKALVKRIGREERAYKEAVEAFDASKTEADSKAVFAAQTKMLSSRLELTKLAAGEKPSASQKTFLALGQVSLGLRQAIEGNGNQAGLESWVKGLEKKKRDLLGGPGSDRTIPDPD